MERIMKYLNRVYRASLLDRAAAFRDDQLKGHQLSYILQVCRHPGLSQDELARRLFVNKSTVTRQLLQLEKISLITRRQHPTDRRTRLIFPTEKALELYPRILTYLDSWNDCLTAHLHPEDQETLLRLLKGLAASASQRIREQCPETGKLQAEGEPTC